MFLDRILPQFRQLRCGLVQSGSHEGTFRVADATPCMGALEAHLLTLCLCRNSWTQGGDSDSAPPVGLLERCCTFRRLNSGGGGHLSPEGTWGWAWQAPRGPAQLTVTLVKALRYEGRPVLGGWARHRLGGASLPCQGQDMSLQTTKPSPLLLRCSAWAHHPSKGL